jgi:hypothetical protein
MNAENDLMTNFRMYDEPEGFKIQTYSKTELGQLYHPDLSGRSAQQALYRMLRDTPGLMERLAKNGYKVSCKTISPRFVRMIIEAVGPPF